MRTDYRGRSMDSNKTRGRKVFLQPAKISVRNGPKPILLHHLCMLYSHLTTHLQMYIRRSKFDARGVEISGTSSHTVCYLVSTNPNLTHRQRRSYSCIDSKSPNDSVNFFHCCPSFRPYRLWLSSTSEPAWLHLLTVSVHCAEAGSGQGKKGVSKSTSGQRDFPFPFSSSFPFTFLFLRKEDTKMSRVTRVSQLLRKMWLQFMPAIQQFSHRVFQSGWSGFLTFPNPTYVRTLPM